MLNTETIKTQDTMDMEEFQSRLNVLVDTASRSQDVLDYSLVETTFQDMGLEDEKYPMIVRFLEAKGIQVLSVTDDTDEEDLLDAEDVFADEDTGAEIELTAEESEPSEDDLSDDALLKGDAYINLEDPVRMYLKEIGRVRLLTPEQEIILCRRMEDGVLAQKILKTYYGDETYRVIRTSVQNDGDIPMEDDAMPEMDLEEESPVEDTSEVIIPEHAEDQECIPEMVQRYFVLDWETPEEEKAFLEERDEKCSVFCGLTMKGLQAIVQDGMAAKDSLMEANLRLVVSIAKKYVSRGLTFLDLIQEGNLGLLKAAEKFDYRKGFKFSTYATWWIRQAITRAIADQARTIRIPVHMVETINKMVRIQRALMGELGRDPTPEELSREMNLPISKVEEIMQYSMEPVSMEAPVGDEEDSQLGDFVSDDKAVAPDVAAANIMLREQLDRLLNTLSEREEKVLRLRFGFDDGKQRTLEEVGQDFGVTRERIRQIEAKALRKLRHPARSRTIRDFM